MADRHYSRQKIGSQRFVPPGRCIVLKAKTGRLVNAVWATSWPYARYVKHAWRGAWINSIFRNEGAGLSSELICDAIAATRMIAKYEKSWEGGHPPELGMVTFINTDEVKHKRDPGRCYLRAGFRRAACPKHADDRETGCLACDGMTEGRLVALQMLPDDMPPAAWPRENFPLFMETA